MARYIHLECGHKILLDDLTFEEYQFIEYTNEAICSICRCEHSIDRIDM